MTKRIYIISTAHPYNDVRVTHRIARSFIENGFDVSWFGPAPNDEFKPLYGIRFYFFKNNLNRYDRLIAGFKLKNLLKNQSPADVYFAVDPDSAKVANFFANKYGSRSVFDIHEIFHKDMLYHHFPAYLIPLLGRIVKHQVKNSCKNASLVVGVGETRIYPFLNVIKKYMVIRHCVPTYYVNGLRAVPLKKDSKEVLIMQGKVSLEQGTLKLLLAAQRASVITNIDVKVVVFRLYLPSLTENAFMKYINEHSLEKNILLLDPVSFDQMFSILSRCDIGAISYQRKMGIECMPNRIFEFMAVGLPVLVPTYAIEMQKILVKYNCGISVDMEDVEDIANGIARLILDPSKAAELGNNGLNFYLKECNWENESRELIEWIKN